MSTGEESGDTGQAGVGELEYGSAQTTMHDEVASYLQTTGWAPDRAGPFGAMWHHRETSSSVAVPHHLRYKSREWNGVIERLSAWSSEPMRLVAERVRFQFVDVARLQAANDFAIADTIALSAGRAMLASAETLVRAAGTTAQRLRSSIDGNYSRKGDAIAVQARLGQTEVGSYIIPVMIPLSPPQQVAAGLNLEEMPARAVHEPSQRRVSRTLAQALSALESQVIQPGKQVHKKDLHAFIEAGGSREIVNAVMAVVAQPSVATLTAKFAWGGGYASSSSLPTNVEVPSAARELLEQASTLLREMRISSNQILTGPVVYVRMQPGDPYGEVGIQTVRSGRPAEVHVRMTADDIDRAHLWAVEKRIVLVEGAVAATRGQPLTISNPIRVQPIDETMLNGTY